MFARHGKAEDLLQPIEERRCGLFVDAHRPVALHIAVAAHWARAGARAADIAAQEQQVDDHLDGRHRMLVLRDPHAPAGDDAAGLDVCIAGLADFVFRQARFGLDGGPRFGAHVGGKDVEATGVLGDERVIDDGGLTAAARHVIALDHVFDDALDRCQVTTDADLMVFGADAGGAQRQHLDLALRIGKALQPALAQRVERHDVRAALGGLAQLAEHARVVRPRVLAEDEDGVGAGEIIERDGALAHADAAPHARAGGLVAHVGAVGEVVRAVRAHEQLVKEGRFIAGAAGGVEDRLVRIGQCTQVLRDQREGGVPFDRDVLVTGGVVDHRVREAPLVFQRVIGPVGQFAHGVLCEELRRGAAGGGLGRDRLHTVLAKLERGGVVPIRPGAAGAVEAIGLIGRQHRLRALGCDAL